MATADETELIARAKRGDVEAFSLLASQHQQRMYGLAFRFCGNHHDAEDLLQEALMRAYRAIGQFKGMSSFATWLSRIMVNSLINHKRRKSSQPMLELNVDAFKPGSERTTYNHVLAAQILQRLDALPARHRLMFILKYQEGLTCEEVADQFDTTVATVKKTLFRIVHRLRSEFQTNKTTLDEGHNARLPEIL